jgi:hypothetical protein
MRLRKCSCLLQNNVLLLDLTAVAALILAGAAIVASLMG